MTKRQIAKIIISVLIAALTALGAGFGLSAETPPWLSRARPSRVTTLKSVCNGEDLFSYNAEKRL